MSANPISILAVDDSVAMRRQLLRIFSGDDYVLHLASTAREGLQKAATHSCDVVLLDYILPDMKATAFCREFAKISGQQSTPIIVTSTKGEQVLKGFAEHHGVVDTAGKPFDGEQLQRQVQIHGGSADSPSIYPTECTGFAPDVTEVLYDPAREDRPVRGDHGVPGEHHGSEEGIADRVVSRGDPVTEELPPAIELTEAVEPVRSTRSPLAGGVGIVDECPTPRVRAEERAVAAIDGCLDDSADLAPAKIDQAASERVPSERSTLEGTTSARDVEAHGLERSYVEGITTHGAALDGTVIGGSVIEGSAIDGSATEGSVIDGSAIATTLGSTRQSFAEQNPPPGQGLFGSTRWVPLSQLCEGLQRTGASGLLRLRQHQRTTWIYFVRGVVLLAFPVQGEKYVEALLEKIGQAGQRHRWCEYQERHQRPFLVHLMESEKLPDERGVELLGIGTRLAFSMVFATGDAEFSWNAEEIPDYVVTWGRPCPLTVIQLEELRHESVPEDLERSVGVEAQIWRRRIDGLGSDYELNAAERRVLSLVDGRAATHRIVERSELERREALIILHRLQAVQLIHRYRRSIDASVVEPMISQRRRWVFCDPGLESFREQARRALATLHAPIDAEFCEYEELLKLVVKEPAAQMIVISGDRSDGELKLLHDQLRESMEIPEVTLVVLLEPHERDRFDTLLEGGADRVLIKPCLLEALIDCAPR